MMYCFRKMVSTAASFAAGKKRLAGRCKSIADSVK